MTAEPLPAIRADTVLAAAADFDVEDRASTNVVWNLGLLRSLLHDVSPREAEEVAAYVFGLLEREPVKGAPRYAAHRMILGCLASELRTYASDAGEPVGLWADLRDAHSQAEENRILDRLEEQAIAYHRHSDDVLAAGRAQRAAAAASPPPTEESSMPPSPAQPAPADDDFVLP